MFQKHGIAAVPHGFRSSFRDWAAEETNHPREVIEAAPRTCGPEQGRGSLSAHGPVRAPASAHGRLGGLRCRRELSLGARADPFIRTALTRLHRESLARPPKDPQALASPMNSSPLPEDQGQPPSILPDNGLRR